jgi:hypothetical protein
MFIFGRQVIHRTNITNSGNSIQIETSNLTQSTTLGIFTSNKSETIEIVNCQSGRIVNVETTSSNREISSTPFSQRTLEGAPQTQRFRSDRTHLRVTAAELAPISVASEGISSGVFSGTSTALTIVAVSPLLPISALLLVPLGICFSCGFGAIVGVRQALTSLQAQKHRELVFHYDAFLDHARVAVNATLARLNLEISRVQQHARNHGLEEESQNILRILIRHISSNPQLFSHAALRVTTMAYLEGRPN